MKYSFLRYFLSLKVVKFDTKMYLNFSNFFGGEPRLGGNKPWSKNGDKCRMVGLTKFSPDGGNPQSPQEKNPGYYPIHLAITSKFLLYFVEISFLSIQQIIKLMQGTSFQSPKSLGNALKHI